MNVSGYCIGRLKPFLFFGYRKWSVYLAQKVFGISDAEHTPAHDPELRDDVDYMPVDKHVLWGTTTLPLLALLRLLDRPSLLFGVGYPLCYGLFFLFYGAIHDFGALVLVRVVGELWATWRVKLFIRVRLLLQIIYFLIWVVLAVALPLASYLRNIQQR